MFKYIVNTNKKSWTFESSRKANALFHKTQKQLKKGEYVSLTKLENETELQHRFYYKGD